MSINWRSYRIWTAIAICGILLPLSVCVSDIAAFILVEKNYLLPEWISLKLRYILAMVMIFFTILYSWLFLLGRFIDCKLLDLFSSDNRLTKFSFIFPLIAVPASVIMFRYVRLYFDIEVDGSTLVVVSLVSAVSSGMLGDAIGEFIISEA